MRLGLAGRLRALRAEIEAWPQVPGTARAFHRARRLLLDDLEAHAGRLLPFGGGEILAELQERALRLEPVARGLVELLERRDEASTLLGEVAGAGAATSVISRWRVALGRLGESVRGVADLDAERRQLDELWQHLVAARRSVREGPAAAPPPPPRGARPELTESSGADPAPSPPPAAEGERPGDAVPPAPPAGRSVNPAPPSDHLAVRRRLESLSQPLWDWARFAAPPDQDAVNAVLGRREVAERALEEGADTGEPIDDVLRDARELLERLDADAAAVRRSHREALEARLRTLSTLRLHGDLEERAEALFARPVDGVRDHESWLAEHDATLADLRDRLHNDHRRIDEAFAAAVRELGEGLETIHRRLLTGEAAAALESLASELRELAAGRGVEARFAALDRLRALRGELDQWRSKAEAEQAAYLQRGRRLLERLESLESLLDGAPACALDGGLRLEVEEALELPGVVGSAEAAETAEHAPSSLDAALAGLERLEGRLGEEAERFIAVCDAERRGLAEQSRSVASLLDIAVTLDLLAPDALPSPAPATSPGEPAASRAALDAARQRLGRLEALRGEVEEASSGGLGPARRELESLDEARLRPGERQERGELLAEARAFTEPSDGEGASLETRLGWLRRQADLVDRVEGDLRRAAERHRQLAERLEDLEHRRLTERCPRRLVERAHALVYGLRPAYLEDPGATAQLDAAETLLSRLEIHARARLAQDLDRAREQLTGDPSSASSSALAELTACPPGELPSPSIHRRVLQVAGVSESP